MTAPTAERYPFRIEPERLIRGSELPFCPKCARRRTSRPHPAPCTEVHRFWRRVEQEGECWAWVGPVKPNGYGVFCPHRGVAYSVHRYSYELNVGPIPAGLCVLHRCDNRRCIRPSHLFVGTQQDNMDDMRAKGRQGYDRPRVKKPHCKWGHAFTPDNTYVTAQGARCCITCRRAHQRAIKRHRRSQAA